jgi:hypothetical protein
MAYTHLCADPRSDRVPDEHILRPWAKVRVKQIQGFYSAGDLIFESGAAGLSKGGCVSDMSLCEDGCCLADCLCLRVELRQELEIESK